MCTYIRYVLPARSFGEHNVIRMLVRVAFDKLNTREILPVSHGLFEQRFVRTAKATVDLVRYYPEIPDPFFSRRGRSASSRVNDVSENKQITIVNRYWVSIKTISLYHLMHVAPSIYTLPLLYAT